MFLSGPFSLLQFELVISRGRQAALFHFQKIYFGQLELKSLFSVLSKTKNLKISLFYSKLASIYQQSMAIQILFSILKYFWYLILCFWTCLSLWVYMSTKVLITIIMVTDNHYFLRIVAYLLLIWWFYEDWDLLPTVGSHCYAYSSRISSVSCYVLQLMQCKLLIFC